MEKNNYLILGNDFIQYCKINNIDDVEKKAKEVFKRGFDLEKYGNSPVLREGNEKNTNIKPQPVISKKDILPPPSAIKKKKDDLYD